MVANKDLNQRCVDLEKELGQANESQKALVLQRKTLITSKESVQKELEKVLLKSEKQIAEKEKALQTKTSAFEAMKMEADATIQELRD